MADPRCCAFITETKQWCREPAVGILRHDPPSRWGWGGTQVQPLCGKHGNPSFHLRPLGGRSWWRWVPLNETEASRG